MSYYYRNPLHTDQQEVEHYVDSDTPNKSRSGCLKVLLVLMVLAVAGAVVAIFLAHQAVNQRIDDSDIGALADNPAVESVLDRHGLSMWDLFLLGREMEGASQQEVIAKAQEMGLTEQDMQELLNDSEIRDLVEQFLGR